MNTAISGVNYKKTGFIVWGGAILMSESVDMETVRLDLQTVPVVIKKDMKLKT